MKTSEFIREAVDKYLAANTEECYQEYPSKYTGLFAVFWHIPAATNLLQLIIQDEARGKFHSYRLFDGDITEESQAIRFMLAEFMALYFEDFGD